MSADEHGVYRLGDMVACSAPQLFEQLEEGGVRVGAISPMNAVNRLREPAYFVPDAWTTTPCDGSFWSKFLSKAVAQAVNDNAAQRLTFKTAASLLAGLVRFASPRNYWTYLSLAIRSGRAPWRKALFLDLFLHDLHRALLRSKRPSFSVLFLNAGAHIQHHYFFNSRAVTGSVLRNPEWYIQPGLDPYAEMLRIYDRILGDYLRDYGSNLVIATGLTQQPYDRVKFYYRLRDHSSFLRLLGIRFKSVEPRMTRDFLVDFETAADAQDAENVLSALVTSGDNIRIFNEIDNRGQSLFVTLTYPFEVRPDLIIQGGREPFRLADHVVFVAIKNGMHDGTGFLWCGSEFRDFAPEDGAHVKHLHGAVLAYFGLGKSAPSAP
jgi:hypothetical protein